METIVRKFRQVKTVYPEGYLIGVVCASIKQYLIYLESYRIDKVMAKKHYVHIIEQRDIEGRFFDKVQMIGGNPELYDIALSRLKKQNND